MTNRRTNRPGLTLLELMVVVGVMGIILSITLPALAAARLATVRTAAVAYQQYVGGVLLSYAADHDGKVPYWGTPGTDYAAFHVGGQSVGGSHWHHIRFWGAYIESLGYDGFAASRAGSGPARYFERPIGAPFTGGAIHFLSNTLYTTDVYWTHDRDRSVRDYTGRRLVEITFPANKGIMHQVGSFPEGRDQTREGESVLNLPDTRWIVFFGDGHGDAVRRDELINDTVETKYSWNWPVYATLNGLQGRDTR